MDVERSMERSVLAMLTYMPSEIRPEFAILRQSWSATMGCFKYFCKSCIWKVL